jgi:hypothetical protein
MPAMRKYTFASSANGSLYPVRRLLMSRRPCRTCSDTEVTFNESTSLSAAFLTAFGMRRTKDSFSGETGCAELTMVIKPDIFDRFDVIALGERMNQSVIGNTSNG